MEKKFAEFVSEFEKILRVDESFDISKRELVLLGKQSRLYYVDGCVKDTILEKILEFLMKSEKYSDAIFKNPGKFINAFIPYIEVNVSDELSMLCDGVLKGETVILIDGMSKGIIINCRNFPSRDIDEPENEKVIRGARDGFCETLLKNTAVIRRRIRNPALTVKKITVGTEAKCDIALLYMSDRANIKFVSGVVKKLENLNVYGLSMGHESLAECLIGQKWYNPFPKIRYTERPDSSAAMLMEGSVIILCDNSPEAMILPTSIFDFFQDTGDYYHPPLTGTYLRFLRGFIFVLTVLLTPTWYLLISNPDWLPVWLNFLKVSNTGGLPIIVQLYLIEAAIDGLKLASLNTPSTLNNSLSIIGGLILGDFSVQSGWFVPEVILYMAFVSIANFSQPSNELGYAFKFIRVLILTFTYLFGWVGYISGIVFSLVLIATNKTVDGSRSYLYPLIPFDFKAMKRMIFRVRLKPQK